MDKIYAPWRDRYIRAQSNGEQSSGCVFCDLFSADSSDDERLVLCKNKNIAVLLNLYPYNGGHLLIVPNQHVADFSKLPQESLQAFMPVIAQCIDILKKELGCTAVNFGANIGKDAGAGIPDHVHVHIVPRFTGDTGFFTTVGQAKQISVDLQKIYNKLKPYFVEFFK